MASFIRLGVVRALSNSIARTTLRQRRNINTSTKKASVGSEICPAPESKNWVSYGFSTTDKSYDRFEMHATYFLVVSGVFVVGGFLTTFLPDPGLFEWAQREAFLELRRREAQGLPPIDDWYIHPDKIILPTDEELGDTEIII